MLDFKSDEQRERKRGKKKTEVQRLLVGRARGSKWDRDALLMLLSSWRPNKRGWSCSSRQLHSQHSDRATGLNAWRR